MGGYGSGRWGWHGKKTQVEECHKLPLSLIKSHLKPGWRGHVTWGQGGERIASIRYEVWGENGKPREVYLIYTITKRDETKLDFHYPVKLTPTPLPWGGVRYWFICPLDECGRRVGCLYLPPGGKYFGCRHCYNLSYESQSEWHRDKGMFASLAGLMQDTHPGMNWKDIKDIFEDKQPRHRNRLAVERYLAEQENYDPYEGYLSEEALCQQSGLTHEKLIKLEEARLLVPDTKDGRYRPKLAGWGKKLAYLLGEGWGIEEIRRWSKERWKSKNPREWPPERVDYDR